MKKLISLLILIFAYTTFFAQNKVEVKSKITDVKVLLNNAEITQKATVTLKAGQNILFFPELSTLLQPNSIRLNIDKKVDILQINPKKDYLTNTKITPQIKVLKDSLLLLDNKIQNTNDLLNAYQTEKSMLNQNQKIGGQNTGVDINQLKQTADFFRTRLIEINTQISKLTYSRTEFQQKHNRIQTQLKELNAKAYIPTMGIEVIVEASQSLTVPVTLNYIVSGAGWSPVYDIKADEDNEEQITLVYRANVYNNTNMDWDNVNLVLSTNNPNETNQLPLLTTWFVKEEANIYNPKSTGYVQKKAMPVQNEPMVEKQELVDDVTGNIVEQEQYQAAVPVLSYEFEIPKKISIPSVDKPYIVEISETELNADFSQFAITKLDPDVFIVAQVTGWQNVNLIDGPANVFYDGSYIGKTFISTRNVSDTINFSLGRDSKVLVTRHRLNQYNSTQFIGSKKKVTFEYQFEVKNNHSYPIHIVLIDQIPISQSDQIEVKSIEITNGKLNESTGEVKWTFDLKPGEVQKVNFSFYVKYPKSMNVPLIQNEYRNLRYFEQ